MTVPISGIELIKRFEGCHLKAYPDPLSGGKPYTIGWGTTRKMNGSEFALGETISQEEADELLEKQLEVAYLPPLKKIPYFNEMSEEQVGALLSFAYNLGARFYGSEGFETISRRLKNKEWDRVPEALLLYRNPGTAVEAGLKRRRIAEGALWSRGDKKQMNRQITALTDTVLKKEPKQSFELDIKQRKDIKKGKSYDIDQITDLGAHSRVELSWGAGTWYIYNPHWNVGTHREKKVESSGQRIVLGVKYFSQRDSETSHAHRMCFSSSCSMAADYIRPNAIQVSSQEDDFYLKHYVFPHGDTTDPWAQIHALASLDIRAEFRQNLNPEDIKTQIRAGIPVPIGILHHGPVNSPRGGGHWICVIGFDEDKQCYIVHDPYGDLDLIYGGYYGSINGASLEYSFTNLDKRWMVDGPNTGWGIIIKRD